MLPGEHHPMLIRLHLDHVTFPGRAVAAIEDEIDAALDAIEGAWGISADGVPSGRTAGVNPSRCSRYEVPRSVYGTLNSRMSSAATRASVHR
jgi:hypothetical protein